MTHLVDTNICSAHMRQELPQYEPNVIRSSGDQGHGVLHDGYRTQ
jgi:hypothetical protein